MTSNVYAALLDALRPAGEGSTGGLFGTLAGVSPLTVRVRGADITKGLFYPRGMTFYEEQIGCELALLPCEGGFLILFQVEGGST